MLLIRAYAGYTKALLKKFLKQEDKDIRNNTGYSYKYIKV